MARRRSISDEQILKAAREVFLEDGPAAATSRVAERAGISEASVFKRFGTKQRLFCLAMRPKGPPEWLGELACRAGTGELRGLLEELVARMIAFYREVLPKLMLLWSNQVMVADLYAHAPEHPLAQSVRGVSRVLEREVEVGRLAPHDTETVARSLIGASMHFVFSEFAGVAEIFKQTDRAYASSLIGVLLRGIGGEVDGRVESDGAVGVGGAGELGGAGGLLAAVGAERLGAADGGACRVG